MSNSKNLYIYGKRWYTSLVINKNKKTNPLMNDYTVNDLVDHLVVCFTPDTLPHSNKPFVTPDGSPRHIFAFFDSYLEFYNYMLKFPEYKRSFYEVIFGELPQKPHFDIDVAGDEFMEKYPTENIDTAAAALLNAIIMGCEKVLAFLKFPLSVEKDVLIYSSHGYGLNRVKRSFHIVLANKCHDGNKEAEAFFKAVIEDVRVTLNGKYIEFVDNKVYSPRQQFRILGCQKTNSGRQKVYYPEFFYNNTNYKHEFREVTDNPNLIKMAMIYESLVSFTPGCVFIPSLVVEKNRNYDFLGGLDDISEDVVKTCMDMMRSNLSSCPFEVKEVKGQIISLKRSAASYCPNCERNHEHENPMIFVIDGRVYWNCRRNQKHIKIGYLADEILNKKTNIIEDVDELSDNLDYNDMSYNVVDTSMMLGDMDLGKPTLPPLNKYVDKSSTLPPTTKYIETTKGLITPKFGLVPGDKVKIGDDAPIITLPIQTYKDPILEIAKNQNNTAIQKTKKEEVVGSLSSLRNKTNEISF